MREKRKKRPSHLRDSILYTSLFTIAGILAILLPLSYSIAANLLRQNARTYTEQLLSQVNNSIDYYIGSMTAVSDFLVDDPAVTAYLASEVSGPGSDAELKLKALAGTRPDFVNLLIFREDDKFIASREHVGVNPYRDYRGSGWYQQTVAAQGAPVLSSSRVENTIAGEYRWVVSLSRALFVRGELRGVLLIDLNFQSIADICNSLSYNENGYVFILGSDNRLVYHPLQRLIYSGLKSERFDLVSRSESPTSVIQAGTIYTSSMAANADWIICSVFNTGELVNVSPVVIGFFIAIGLLFALIALIISYQAAKRLSEPILSLKASMKQFEKGDFDVKADLKVNNEIAELGDGFNIMTERIKKLVENSLLIEEQKRKSEIQALQSQIRPHFLYNTLESIIWMASLGEKDQVIEMTSSLSKLMRASVSNASELVSLQTEIDYVANYLKIQKMRYQDKLNYRFEIADEVRLAKVLRLIVQPMVENAIYHGIKPLREPGLIIIDAARSGADLVIRISDNGVGFNEDVLRRSGDVSQTVRAAADGAKKDEEHGIGIDNVQNRIQLFFGAAYGLRIESAPPGEVLAGGFSAEGIRTRVILTLPLIFS